MLEGPAPAGSAGIELLSLSFRSTVNPLSSFLFVRLTDHDPGALGNARKNHERTLINYFASRPLCCSWRLSLHRDRAFDGGRDVVGDDRKVD